MIHLIKFEVQSCGCSKHNFALHLDLSKYGMNV